MNQILPIDNKLIPNIVHTENTSSNKKVNFHRSEEGYYMIPLGKSTVVTGEMHENAKVLAEHIDIVEESRMEIQKGNTITWDELKKKRNQRKVK